MLKSIGSDMEVFAEKKKVGHVALCGMIGGTKENPIQIPHLPAGYMLQEDNVALEFNIPVCYNVKEFINAFSIIKKEVALFLGKQGLNMSKKASVSFDKKELTHPNAFIFGCEPDFSAWSERENPKPECEDPFLRTCGGHIHVGTQRDMTEVVKNMDLLLGVPSIILDDSPASIQRRKLYGKAGAMRPKPYGFEYRTLSNFWMFDNKTIEWVYRQTEKACNANYEFSPEDEEFIQTCINTGDKTLANMLISKYNIALAVKKQPNLRYIPYALRITPAEFRAIMEQPFNLPPQPDQWIVDPFQGGIVEPTFTVTATTRT